MNKYDLIKHLNLSEHVEGGYFSETYKSSLTIETNRSKDGMRPLMSSIYYLLTNDRPTGYFHINKSDILHFHQSGSPITYIIINPAGELTKIILGPDVTKGHQLQMLVKGGDWKASFLPEGEYGLISEAVAPGFSYDDMTIATKEKLSQSFPHLWEQIFQFIKPERA